MPARRALFVVHSYFLRDTRPRRLARALVERGWSVDVICARDEGERVVETVEGVRVFRLPARRRRGSKLRYVFEYLSFTALALVAVTLASAWRRYHAIHVIGIPNMLVLSTLVPRLLGTRVSLDMRDPLPEFFRAKYGLSERSVLVRAMLLEELVSARFASNVVTVVPSMARLYERSVAADRITVVMNAPDPAVFAPPPGSVRDPSDRTMLYTGTVADRYGVDTAVRALGCLRDEIPQLRLRLVTKNVTEEGVPLVQELARAEGVADRVSVEGPYPLEAMPEIVASSWVGVQPNRPDPLMEHSLSQKVLEWASVGLPVICGRTAALADVFDGDDVMFHEPGDVEGLCARIREAHADPDALAARVERARAAARRIPYDEQIRRFVELLEGTPGAR